MDYHLEFSFLQDQRSPSKSSLLICATSNALRKACGSSPISMPPLTSLRWPLLALLSKIPTTTRPRPTKAWTSGLTTASRTHGGTAKSEVRSNRVLDSGRLQGKKIFPLTCGTTAGANRCPVTFVRTEHWLPWMGAVLCLWHPDPIASLSLFLLVWNTFSTPIHLLPPLLRPLLSPPSPSQPLLPAWVPRNCWIRRRREKSPIGWVRWNLFRSTWWNIWDNLKSTTETYRHVVGKNRTTRISETGPKEVSQYAISLLQEKKLTNHNAPLRGRSPILPPD